MGLAASSNSGGSGSGQAASSSATSGDVIRRCNCYSMSYLSLDRRCYRHSLTFNHASDKTAINPKQKKKRSYGFATFKKKLIGKRRHCKGSDHGRCFREHFLDCPSDILKALLGQFEALTMVKDLSVQADLARPPAQTLGQCLVQLFEEQSCCDLTLVYQGHRIPVHKNVLMARCPYFSRHLAFAPSSHRSESSEFHLRTRNSIVPIDVLKAVLRYLYTGNTEILATQSPEAISILEDEFLGIPNSLESDVSFLLETKSLANCRLIFDDCDFLCHKAILSARSSFFRKLIANGRNNTDEIRLDGEIIPGKYGRVILHAMYLDTLDLGLIRVNSASSTATASSGASSLGSEVTSAEPDFSDDVMNLYEIGRFLEFNFLAQSCEDLLMQMLNLSNVNKILDWSLENHGSAWITRQVFQFLEEEFFSVTNNMDVLGSLNQETVARIIKSDFTQASESEILQALIKWGEHQLSLKSETKDCTFPVSNTATLTRKAPKRSQICDSELKESLSTLFPLLRVPHVLPRDRTSEVLDMALQRNLFSVLPNFTSQVNSSTKYSPWDPRCSNGLFVRPRLFLPYFEECKKLIQDRCAQDPEIISSNSPCVGVPETLYMFRSRNNLDADQDLEFQTSKLPDNELISRMLERTKKLVNSASVQRALSSNFTDLSEIMNLVELRVVREYNLPDTYASFLHKARAHSGDLQEAKPQLSAARMVYQPSEAQYLEDYPRLTRQGPDVTLASSAVSSLSLHQPSSPATGHGPLDFLDSPDLVSGKSETLLPVSVSTTGGASGGGGGIRQYESKTLQPTQLWSKTSTSAGESSSRKNSGSSVRLSHSYCTGPSHMYL